MIIVGVDYHPSVQQVAFLDTETGEIGERRLSHSDGEAERFYRDLQRKQVKVRVGIEATGHARWFERLLAELNFELTYKRGMSRKKSSPSSPRGDGCCCGLHPAQSQFRRGCGLAAYSGQDQVVGGLNSTVS